MEISLDIVLFFLKEKKLILLLHILHICSIKYIDVYKPTNLMKKML